MLMKREQIRDVMVVVPKEPQVAELEKAEMQGDREMVAAQMGQPLAELASMKKVLEALQDSRVIEAIKELAAMGEVARLPVLARMSLTKMAMKTETQRDRSRFSY